MKSIEEFLSDISSLDIKLKIDGDRLYCSAPQGLLTPELSIQLRERKIEIFEFLQNHTNFVSSSTYSPIVPVSRETNLPLSFAQQRLWFLNQLEPNNTSYNIPLAVRLNGTLNVLALEQSLNEIVQRHEALRTTFTSVNGQPIQVINPTPTLKLSIVDLQEYPINKQEAEVLRLAVQETQLLFNLAQGLLLRATLLHLSEQQYVLLFTMHHIVSDGWSIGLLIKEVTALYEAFCKGKPSPLSELPIQYVDFAVWQRQWLQGEVLKSQISYWRKQLEDAPRVLDLPTDHPRSAIRKFRGATYSFELSQELSVALNILSQQQRSTLFMTLLAVFQILLWRYTGSEDIVVGSPIANRNRNEIKELISFFVNTLVLRTNLAGNPTFEELLNRVREMTLAAYAHEDLPFELLVDELQPQRNLSHTPLFQVAFVLQNAPISALELPGLTLSYLTVPSVNADFDLNLDIIETADKIFCNLHYNTNLFESSTIKRMAGHFQTLLKQITVNPKLQLSELSLLTEPEKFQLLREWNSTEVEYPQQLCIHELFEAQVEKTPDAVAVVFEDEQLTYRELNTKANQLAHYLRSAKLSRSDSLGVKPEVLVGIFVERSVSMVIGVLAILKAGGAYVPLDPAYPPERLAFILQDAAVSVLLTQQQLIENLPQDQTTVICLDADWESIAKQSSQNLISDCITDNLAYIIYTSGSTGQPKGVLVNHSNVVRLLAATESWYNFNQHDVWTLFHSIAFDFSVWEIWGALLYGGQLVVVPYWLSRSPEDFYKLLLTQQVTILNQTPSAFRQLIQVEESLENSNNLTLRKVIFGGEALQLESLRPWFERHGDRSPQLINMYGITETTVHVTYRPLTIADLEVASASLIGRPISDLQIYLLDQYQQPVPIGVPGEMYIGGAGVVRGYLNRPTLTPERFIPNRFSDKPNARLYKSGDLARYLANGEIEYLGRIDHQVKVRGFRIELGEIEALISQYPAVLETVVVVREDSADSKNLVTYIVSQTEETLVIPELRSFLESKLPNYMIPATFVTLSALPLTPNGKVDRKALPVPEITQVTSSNIVPPSTPIENLLAGIWAEILSIDKVGINNNFFELGGHSLIATRVMSQIRQVFQVELPLRYLFEKPTIAGLAKEIEKAIKVDSRDGTTNIEPIERSQKLPLSFAQRRLWFLAELEPDSPFYNIPAVVRLEGQLNVEALQQTFNEIISRHEVLRTNFQTIEGQPVAVICEENPLTLSILDISELSTIPQEAEVRQQALQAAKKPFDLANEPLLRVSLLRLGKQSYVLLLVMHHIISDGWSIGIFTRELAVFYAAFSKGEPSPLPELPIQYIDFAYWQNQWMQTEVMEKQLSYWKQQLANLPMLELPTDYTRPEIQTFRGSSQYLELPKELCEEIKALGYREGVTLFMTLVTVFKTLMHHYTKQNDIVVGTDIANRNLPQTEGIIGFFVNQLVLRTNLSGDPTFQKLLERIREVTLAAYEHQDLPFDQLVLALKPKRELSRTPLFQSKFVLQNAPTSPLEVEGLKLKVEDIDDNDTAKFDLLMTIWESEEGLSGSLEYSTDLFNASAIAKFITDYEIILRAVVAQPNIKLTTIKEMLATADKQRQDAKQEEFKQARSQKFKAFKSQSNPKVINLSPEELITESFLQNEGKLPLVISPKFRDLNLAIWAEKNQEFIINNLLKYGGILFRGFTISQKEDFEQFVSAVCPQLMPYVESSTPRTKLSEKVYTSTEFPANQTIALHNESSYANTYPMKIWFCCIEPANQGGETPIADVRKVFQRIHPRIRERFQEKGWMLVRNYGDGFGLPWQKVYHTTDKAVMEEYCRNACIEVEWKDHNRLRTRQVRPAIAEHPKTTEMVWFNHVVFWHVSSLQTQFREKFFSEFTEEDLPYNTFYGDGFPIEDSVIAEIREAYQQEMIVYPWQKGDILMLDNMLTSHARNSYSGSRKILTAMGEPFQHHF